MDTKKILAYFIMITLMCGSILLSAATENPDLSNTNFKIDNADNSKNKEHKYV